MMCVSCSIVMRPNWTSFLSLISTPLTLLISPSPLQLWTLKVRFGFKFSLLGLGSASSCCLSKIIEIFFLLLDLDFLIMLQHSNAKIHGLLSVKLVYIWYFPRNIPFLFYKSVYFSHYSSSWIFLDAVKAKLWVATLFKATLYGLLSTLGWISCK
jgi:hypothetical protein